MTHPIYSVVMAALAILFFLLAILRHRALRRKTPLGRCLCLSCGERYYIYPGDPWGINCPACAYVDEQMRSSDCYSRRDYALEAELTSLVGGAR